MTRRRWLLAALLVLVAGGTAVALFARKPPVAALPTPTPSPAPAAVPAPLALPSKVETWVLTSTTCPKAAMSPSVTVTTTGSRMVANAPGLPEVSGTLEPDGHFSVGNLLGTCTGVLKDGVSTESCGNLLGHCDATYTVRR